ncbi:MAG: hypothetical protein DRH21_06540, partial [Deltaproteobacteria bacterium]
MADQAGISQVGADKGGDAARPEGRFHTAYVQGLCISGSSSTDSWPRGISCPHSYPLFYEPLGLDKGHKILEVGLGSGYGTALAREIVGPDGLVVSIEIDPLTFEFAKSNLEKAGYN